MMSSASEDRGVALVTGAASGIGLAIAHALCREGRRVALCDRDAAGLTAAADVLRAEHGADVRSYLLNVRDEAAVERAVEDIEASLGPIDAVALAAGVLHLGVATEVSSAAFLESLAINAGGVFNVARTTVRKMATRRRGALVTIASNAASTPRLDMAAYCASKAAAVMFTRCLGLEVAGQGVRCNVVSPGSTDTPMLRGMNAASVDFSRVIAGDLTRHRLGIPLARVAAASDIADVVLFLLSDQARHVTMQELVVDGGATL